jgi:hypothetical protein
MKLRIDQFYLFKDKALKFLGYEGKYSYPLFDSYGRDLYTDRWVPSGKFTLHPTVISALKPIPPPR